MKNILSSITLAIFALLPPAHSAVHLSSSKTGQAIIVPFYTVSNQINTMLSLSNTTDDNKAVKIIFKEAKKGEALLSFNVYLTGQDVWTMATGQINEKIKFASLDESCAVGFPSIEDDTTVASDWLWENGTIEIIEMGTLNDLDELNPFDTDCDELANFWHSGQMWDTDNEEKLSSATGGLHVEVTLMDVQQGHSANMPVLHLNGFYGEDNIQHTKPSTAIPNLSTGTNKSLVFSNGEDITTTWPTGYEAVSAVITQHTLSNEFNTETAVAAQTEFIISMPTLHYHLNGSRSPFNTYSSSNLSFWFPTLYTNKQYFNRAGEMKNHYPCGNCSPVPPEVLRHSVSNFVLFRLPDNYVPGDIWTRPAPMLSDVNPDHSGNTLYMLTESIPYEPYEPWSFVNGKINFLLNTSNDRGRSISDPSIIHTFHGMPVIGFAYTKFSNANAQPGLLAQYAFMRKHFGEKKIEISQQGTGVKK